MESFRATQSVARDVLIATSPLSALSTLNLNNLVRKSKLDQSHSNKIKIMADGIDRKADERLEFTTSQDVTVAPTFQDMHLKGKLSTATSYEI